MIATLFYDTLFLVSFILLMVFIMLTGIFSTMGRPRVARVTLFTGIGILVMLVAYGAYLLM